MLHESWETTCQGEAFAMVHGYFKNELATIWAYGALFRGIVEDYKKRNKRPTPDDIIWLASEKLERDLQVDG